MHSTPRSALSISAILLSCLLATACQVVRSLGELSKLQNDLIKEFKENDVRVDLDGDTNTSLTIAFINSPLNAQETEQRKQRAARTASFVSTHYPSAGELQAIWVVFMRVKTRFVVVSHSERLDYFGFDKNGRPLRPSEGPPAPVDETRPAADYHPALDQTDVLIRQMQLEGDINKGFSVLPHFTLPGEVSGGKRSTSFPESVRFDFSSFSEKSLFPGAPKFTFLADGEVMFETSEQFSTSKFDDQFAEYASIGVPYQTFRRMIGRKSLKLKIGDREYAFTDKQLEALREMTRYVKE